MAVHSVSCFSFLVSVCTVKPSMWIYFHIFLLIWISCCNTPVTGNQVIGSSQTVLAKVDDDVILRCHIEPPVDMEKKTVEWSRPDLKPEFVHVLQDGRDMFRYSNPLYKQRTFLFAEELSRGNISLKLSRVKLSDEGAYKCFVPALKSSSLIQLRVGAVPQPVISLIGSKDDVLSCDSGCWFPQPEMSWLDSDGNNITAESSVSKKPSQHCYVVQRNVTVIRGGHVTCRVQLPHINYTVEILQPVILERVSHPEEESGSAVRVTGWILMTIAVILVAAILGYFYWKKRQTGKQEHINNTAARFVVQHRAELTLKVSRVEDILNSLGTMVTAELDAEILKEKTSIDQMMRLYREILEPGGAEAKAAFYKALEKYEPNLFNTLDNQTEHPAIPQPHFWSQRKCPVLCGGRDTSDTKDRPTEQDVGEHLTKEDAEKAQFVMKNRAQLIQHVCRVMAIVDNIRPRIDDELRTKIEAGKTKQNQMRTLYQMWMPDDRNKARFYNALKLHEPHLLKWLEHRTTKDPVNLTPEEKACFVEENRGHLITNVSRVMAILDTLESMVHSEIYDEIQEEETSMDQMWILYREILQPGGTKVRAAFYNALKVHQPHLLKMPDEEEANHETDRLLNPSDQTVGSSVAIDLHGAQELETDPLLYPSNQTVGSSVAIDLHDAQDLETDPLLNPSNQTVGSSEPTHLVDQHWVERVVNPILDLLSHDVKSKPTIKMMEILHSGIATFIEEQFLPDNLKNPPCSTQQQECISETLEKLDDKKFQVFKLYLQQPVNLEGLQPLPKSLLEKTDSMDTADLIVKTYHSEGDQIVKNVLEKIEQNADKASPEGLEVVNPPSVNDSKKEKGPEGENPPSGSDSEKEKGSKLKKLKASACHFVDQHQDDLIQRVKMVAPILDLLLAEGVITHADYSNVMFKTTTMEKMWELYKLLDSSSEPKAKRIFYKGLQEHEQFLLEDLKNPSCWTHIIDTLKELGQDEFRDFKSHLQQSNNLTEGLQPLPESLLEKTDRMDTANLIVKTYTSNVDQIVMNVLKKMKRNDLVKRFLPKGPEGENPPSGSSNKKEKGPEGEPPTTTSDIGKEKGPKLKQLKGAILTSSFRAVRFVDKERDSLTKRVINVEPILDHLLAKEVIKEAEKIDVMSEPKTVHQMKKLYDILNNADNVTKAKTIFYEGLKKNEKSLLEKLQA